MRILLATGAYPPEIGGPATAMSALAAELRSAGHEVVVLTYGEPRSEAGVAAVSREGNVLRRYVRFAALARKLLPATDVVLATDVFSVGIPIRLALIGMKTCFVLRLGGEWAYEDAVAKGRTGKTLKAFWAEQASNWRLQLAKLDYRWLFGRAARIAVTSDWLRDVLVNALPAFASKFATVWNEAPDAMPGTGSGARPHAPLRLVYIGRFARIKNVEMLSRALKTAIGQGASVEGVFVGSGETLASCKDILHGVQGIYFMGAVPHDALRDILEESDVLALPSLSDICPNAVIEALATGLPCLITAEHGLPRPLAGALELDPLDEKAWTDAILHLASSKNAYVDLRDAAKPIAFPEGKTLADLIIS